MTRSATLTRRELDVLAAYIEVGSYRAVAERLGIAHATVRNHVTSALHKLHVASIAQACVLVDRERRAAA